LHRRLKRLIKNKTAVSNQIRGLLSKFGLVFPCGTNLVGQPLWDNLCGNAALLIGVQGVLDNAQYSVRLPDKMTDMQEEYRTILTRVKGIEQQLNEFADSSEIGQILLNIPGIGIINASAFLAAIDKSQAFNNPKELVVWLGLTPKQHASGNIIRWTVSTSAGTVICVNSWCTVPEH
jgi:transposase